MKKTLFAMLTLALCGSAFATTYELAKDGAVAFLDSGDMLVVNATPTFNEGFSIYYTENITLDFRGANYINIPSGPGLMMSGCDSIHITADTTAKTYWESQLTSSAPLNYIPLVTKAGVWPFGMPDDGAVDFLGTTSGSVTLGNTEFIYVGYSKISTPSDLETAINAIGDNNGVAILAIKGIDGKQGLYLVSKGTPAVPEPATATLSLLALAGLCARRRRK